mmetsp:Transcript_43354/g.50958  ORF Transcript_43354/g.50958 Transcript_43354/m.50958 type:complete len:202 (+) Transcript_43354:633-1238(+)
MVVYLPSRKLQTVRTNGYSRSAQKDDQHLQSCWRQSLRRRCDQPHDRRRQRQVGLPHRRQLRHMGPEVVVRRLAILHARLHGPQQQPDARQTRTRVPERAVQPDGLPLRTFAQQLDGPVHPEPRLAGRTGGPQHRKRLRQRAYRLIPGRLDQHRVQRLQDRRGQAHLPGVAGGHLEEVQGQARRRRTARRLHHVPRSDHRW